MHWFYVPGWFGRASAEVDAISPDTAGAIPIPDPDAAKATARELVEDRIKLLEKYASPARQNAADDIAVAKRRIERAESDERAAAGLREYLKTMEG